MKVVQEVKKELYEGAVVATVTCGANKINLLEVE